MFTAALFTIAKTWKQPKCPSADEWIKMWYLYTMEYYSAVKRKEITAFAATQMDLEIIMLSKVSETQMSYAITYMCNLKKGYNELHCKTDTDSQTEKLIVSKGDRLGVRGEQGVQEGNDVKLGCDDHCTTINVIKVTELKNKKSKNKT